MAKWDRGKLSSMMFHLEAFTDMFFQARHDVSGSLTLSHIDPAKSLSKGTLHGCDALNSSACCAMLPRMLSMYCGGKERQAVTCLCAAASAS